MWPLLEQMPSLEVRAHRHHQPLRPHASRAIASDAGSSALSTAQSAADLVLEDPRLGRGVLLDAGVPIEVVGREIEQHRDPRMERLDRSRAESCWPRSRESCSRSKPRPARSARCRCCRRPARRARRRLEHPAGQRRGGRLALGAGDRDDPSGQPARRQLELADDRRRRRRAPRRSPADAPARRGSSRSDRRP